MSPLALWSFFKLPRSEDGLQPAWLWLMGCLLTLTGVSYVRLWLAGSLNVDDGPYAWLACPWLQLSVSGLLFLAGGAYWRALGAAARHPQPLSRSCLLSAVALQLVVFWAAPLTSNDAFPNLAYGRLAHLGMNPHVQRACDLKPGDELLPLVGHWLEQPSVYGPAVTAAELLPGALPAVAGLVLFKMEMVALSLTLVVMVWSWCRRLPAGRQQLSFLFVAWNPLLIWEVAGQAHNDGLLVLAFFGFGACLLAERVWKAAGWLALALLTKLCALPLLGLFLFGEWRRSPWRASALALWILSWCACAYVPFWENGSGVCAAVISGSDRLCHTSNSVADVVARTMLFWSGEPAQYFWFSAWCTASKFVLALLGLVLADAVRRPVDVIRGATMFLFVQQALGMSWFQPWYPVWLLPLALLAQDRHLQKAVALYSMAMPWFYLPDHPIWLAGRLLVHALPLYWLGRSGLLSVQKIRLRPSLPESPVGGRVGGWVEWALAAAALAAVISALRLLNWYWPLALPEGSVSGTWTALAQNWSKGRFYPSVAEDFCYRMPLFFMLHAGLAGWLGSWTQSGVLLTQAGVAWWLLALCINLRQSGLSAWKAGPVAALGLASMTYQRLSLGIHPDFLASGAVFTALALLRACPNQGRGARFRTAAAAGLLAIAFFLKANCLVFLPCLIWFLFYRRQPDLAGLLTAGGCGGVLAGLVFLQLATDGHFGEQWLELARLPLDSPAAAGGRFLRCLLNSDPFALVLVGLALLAAVPGTLQFVLRRRWDVLIKLALPSGPRSGRIPLHSGGSLVSSGVFPLFSLVLVRTLALCLWPQTWLYDFVDLIGASLLVIGVMSISGPAWRRRVGWSAVAIIAGFIFTSLPGAPSTRVTVEGHGLVTLQNVCEIHQLVPEGVPVFVQNPWFALAIGARPLPLEEENLRRLASQCRPAGRKFELEMQAGVYPYIILDSSEAPSRPEQEPDFWNALADEYRRLQPFYTIVAVRRPLVLLGRRRASTCQP